MKKERRKETTETRIILSIRNNYFHKSYFHKYIGLRQLIYCDGFTQGIVGLPSSCLTQQHVQACCAVVCSDHVILRMTQCFTEHAQVTSDNGGRPFSAASVDKSVAG
jgi:hypothetical protein